ncbi:MAG TPA: 5-methyltetrahydropteroyltriglutamate--homocysteine S-methyltransferase [Solirubrobacteraceae bacterium]|nr:5-methyltetrahydropteroyltriglutamate--homocysteine S-methyltransferase [Solirubrobacteraceae bacterium]
MIRASVHGYPRIGPRRELKTALEGYWAGRITAEGLRKTARALRRQNWLFMRDAGIDLVPSGDFSLYDHVLDTAALVGALPMRFRAAIVRSSRAPRARVAADSDGLGGGRALELYFELARGQHTRAMEMTKWFDTNYHYIVPELSPQTCFALSGSKPLDHFIEAAELGLITKPVLLGPVSFLLLSRLDEAAPASFNPLDLLDSLLEVYVKLLTQLGTHGAEWVQLEEPCFAQDRSTSELEALARALKLLATAPGRPRLCVCTYFARAAEALDVLSESEIEGVGLDLVRGVADVERLQARGLPGKALFAGVVDGRNVWANDLEASLRLLDHLRPVCGELVISTACSLMHVPHALALETRLDPQLSSWLAFAREKVLELALLKRAMNEGTGAICEEIVRRRAALAERRSSKRILRDSVGARLAELAKPDALPARPAPYEQRRAAQQERLSLPLLPTTTIGSFPQTTELRAVRAALRRGEISDRAYELRMRKEIERTIRLQERLGLDVLVHGEPERADMVQHFAERLDGFAVTENGWVQSYGFRCVRPPIIYGDIERRAAMTIGEVAFAQSLTERPVKGIVTGPVTMLQWSFPREDRPREETCLQLALAIRNELADLAQAGIAIVQVDEPAFREGLPLRCDEQAEYLRFAVRAFRLATAVVPAEVQVQTHMCYSDFGAMIEQIKALDADVILIEAARTKMERLDDFARAGYAREVGPGVFDVHAPRVPSPFEMATLLRKAITVLPPDLLWVCPDCGLKTRSPAQVRGALANMVSAARSVREDLAAEAGG